jgi:RNA polymerase sigma factor (sigma-70 family)
MAHDDTPVSDAFTMSDSAAESEFAPMPDPARAALPAGQQDERWQLAWDQRPLLLAMARSRVSWHEAEDVVSEALLRAQHATDVPTSALRSWLVTTTLRLCTDTHRATARDARRRQLLSGHTLAVVPGPEDEVVDRDQARWFASQVQRLPEHQAEAIELRTEGHEIGSIAGRMNLPYKAVESLLSRARKSLRGWAAAAVGVWALSRFLTRRTAQLHVAAAVVVAGMNMASPMVVGAATVSERGGTVQIAPGSNFHDAPGIPGVLAGGPTTSF